MNQIQRVLQAIGAILAIFRHFVSAELVNEIKAAAAEAMVREDWGPGEKTDFVIAKAKALAAATPTPWDDFAISIGAALYVRKYMAKAQAAAIAETDGAE